MFCWRSHKENAELTERFSLSENVRLMQDLPGIHRLVKLTVNEGFLAVLVVWTNPYLAANSWEGTALRQGPLSKITISGILWLANGSLAAVITLFAVCVVRSLISTHLE